MNTLQELKTNSSFQAVPEAQLQWLIDRAQIRQYAAGESIFKKGEPIDYLTILLAGRTRIYMMQGNQQVEYGEVLQGEISGVLPYSRLHTANGNGMAVEDSALLQLHRRHFPEMIQTQHELTEALVHQMLNRVRDYTKFQQQNEKMISLGKLSAGLAHELNNPASAVVRSADALKKHLSNEPTKFKQVISMQITPEQVDRVNELLFAKLQKGTTKPIRLMEKTSREDELTDWMEDHGMKEVYDLSEIFVDYGITANDLDFVNEVVSDAYLSPVLNWLCNVLTTEKMVSEIAEASTRIGNLVKAIKEYSHMDGGADKKKVALRDGLQSTLSILQYKLKTKHINVQLTIPEDLPPVCINPGEMNQVWTNLIDNAIDAMNDGGQLQIELTQKDSFVLTNIIDSGSGIPTEIINQIFDPFFTTKEVGKGTGLGLEIANNIVKHHNGKIKVSSQPGRTEFSVCLPIE